MVNHNAFDDATLTQPGAHQLRRRGLDEQRLSAADVRIVTGFIEPHFFAGFSGGPKGIVPGVAGIKTIMHLHNAADDRRSALDLGAAGGQPGAGRDARSGGAGAAALHGQRRGQPRGARSRRCGPAHYIERARNRLPLRGRATRPVDEPFDIVITTNSGYPLDQNLYQAVKGMSAAARIVRPGGAIIAAAECSDGLPDTATTAAAANAADASEAARDDRGARLRALRPVAGPEPGAGSAQGRGLPVLLARPERCAHAMLDADRRYRGHAGSAARPLRPLARVAVLPEGPQTVPYLMDEPLSPT